MKELPDTEGCSQETTFQWMLRAFIVLQGIILAILKVRTVNLAELADSFTGKAKKASKYKRLQRFLTLFPLDYEMIARFVVQLLGH